LSLSFPRLLRSCSCCGAQFKPSTAAVAGRSTVLCSDKCRAAHKRELSQSAKYRKRDREYSARYWRNPAHRADRERRAELRRQRNGQSKRNRPPPLIQCQQCLRTFRPLSSKTKFCSRECSVAATRKQLPIGVCRHCGAMFQQPRYSKRRHYFYCSRACSAQARHASDFTFKAKPCVVCGVRFVPKSGSTKTCSRACRKKLNWEWSWQSEVRAKKRAANHKSYSLHYQIEFLLREMAKMEFALKLPSQ
jgi:hypothetical protein